MNLFHKNRADYSALRDILQLLRSKAPGKNVSFSFVESETALIPELTLWENVQLVAGSTSWQDFILQTQGLPLQMAQLLQRPEEKARNVEPWERLQTALLRSFVSSSEVLIVDLNENLFVPFYLQQLKKVLIEVATEKQIYLCTHNQSFWLDACETLTLREGFVFKTLPLRSSQKKTA